MYDIQSPRGVCSAVRTIAAVAVALSLCVGTSAQPAYAESATYPDGTKDVTSYDWVSDKYSYGWDWDWVDITSLDVDYAENLMLKTHIANLQKGYWTQLYWQIDVDGQASDYKSDYRVSMHDSGSVAISDSEFRTLTCAITSHVDYAAKTAQVSLPASCVGSPSAVYVSAGTYDRYGGYSCCWDTVSDVLPDAHFTFVGPTGRSGGSSPPPPEPTPTVSPTPAVSPSPSPTPSATPSPKPTPTPTPTPTSSPPPPTRASSDWEDSDVSVRLRVPFGSYVFVEDVLVDARTDKGLAYQPVTLWRRFGSTGSFVRVQTLRTDRTGRVYWEPSKRLRRNTTYHFRFLGSQEFDPSRGGDIRFIVPAKIAASPTDARVRAGELSVVRGQVRSANNRQIVELQRRVSVGWRTIDSVSPHSDGRFRFDVPTRRKGRYAYRVVKPATQHHPLSRSPKFVMAVR